jgi:hypothetical protein
MVRPRHPNKDLESVPRAAEARRWRVERRKKYYKMYGPCDDKHFKTVELTPSGANYLKDLLERDQ